MVYCVGGEGGGLHHPDGGFDGRTRGGSEAAVRQWSSGMWCTVWVGRGEVYTTLMEASMDGHVEVARLLLDSGAQVFGVLCGWVGGRFTPP